MMTLTSTTSMTLEERPTSRQPSTQEPLIAWHHVTSPRACLFESLRVRAVGAPSRAQAAKAGLLVSRRLRKSLHQAFPATFATASPRPAGAGPNCQMRSWSGTNHMITLQCFMEFSKQSFDRVTRAGRQQKQLKTVVGLYLCRADAPGDVLRDAPSRLTLYVVDAIHKKPVRSQHTPAVCRQKSLKETGEREREVKRHRLQVHL